MSKKSENVSPEKQEPLKAQKSGAGENSKPSGVVDFNLYKNNKNMTVPDCELAYEYLERAQASCSCATAAKYAKMALELDPTLTDAKLLLAVHQSKNPEDLQVRLEKLLKEEEEYLKTLDIDEESCAGNYYQIFETRPYLKVYKEYAETLIVQGKMRKAAEACSKICFLNEEDNLGSRYTLMTLYAYLEDRSSAEKLFGKYPEYSSFVLLPMTALYYKLEDIDAASECLRILSENNGELKKAVQIIKSGDERTLMEIMSSPYYVPFSAEEFVFAFMDSVYLYNTMPCFLKWLERSLPKRKTKSKK